MERRVRIPVRVVAPGQPGGVPNLPVGGVQAGTQPSEAEAREPQQLGASGPRKAEEWSPQLVGAATDWKDRALRLQADMDNFRRRQQRLAEDEIQGERERLLGAFLQVVDELERALKAAGEEDGIRKGVELTYRMALRLLEKEGVERLDAEGRPFDPAWHEAVATVPRDGTHAEPGTVVQVAAPGYRLGDKLLRPAKVVVAV